MQQEYWWLLYEIVERDKVYLTAILRKWNVFYFLAFSFPFFFSCTYTIFTSWHLSIPHQWHWGFCLLCSHFYQYLEWKERGRNNRIRCIAWYFHFALRCCVYTIGRLLVIQRRSKMGCYSEMRYKQRCRVFNRQKRSRGHSLQ